MSQIEQDIQKLLESMNEALEREGCSIDFPMFDFNDRKNEIIQELGFKYEYFCSLLDRCKTRKLIEKKTLGLDYSDIALTQKGQEEVLSARKKPIEFPMNIGKMIFNGPAQIGNGNIQNISNYFSIIENEINKSHASDTEKKEAKGLLKKITENPLLCAILDGLISSIIK